MRSPSWSTPLSGHFRELPFATKLGTGMGVGTQTHLAQAWVLEPTLNPNFTFCRHKATKSGLETWRSLLPGRRAYVPPGVHLVAEAKSLHAIDAVHVAGGSRRGIRVDQTAAGAHRSLVGFRFRIETREAIAGEGLMMTMGFGTPVMIAFLAMSVAMPGKSFSTLLMNSCILDSMYLFASKLSPMLMIGLNALDQVDLDQTCWGSRTTDTTSPPFA